jgi:hypothetical protein
LTLFVLALGVQNLIKPKKKPKNSYSSVVGGEAFGPDIHSKLLESHFITKLDGFFIEILMET